MTIKYLDLSSVEEFPTAFVGDIHINSKLSPSFEKRRLEALAKRIIQRHIGTVVLAGDTFDRATPSLEDIKLFYEFISTLRTRKDLEILIISGNHDSHTFNYLPEKAFRHIKAPTLISSKLMLVPYTFLEPLQEHLEEHTYPELTLVSHARCTIEPYIKEETSISSLSGNFKEVILGDIHTQPTLPHDNVTYTTSPSSTTFTQYRKSIHGFLLMSTIGTKPEFVPIAIPTKRLVTVNTVQEAIRFLKDPRALQDMVKLRFAGSSEDLNKLSKLHRDNVIKDFTISSVAIDEESLEGSESLAEFLSSKVSLSEFAFRYFKDALGIEENLLEDLRQKYESHRTKKGSHK